MLAKKILKWYRFNFPSGAFKLAKFILLKNNFFLTVNNMGFNFMKTIGILGGMGPEATAILYRKIVSMTNAEKDQDHIRTIIYSNTKIPNRVDAIIEDDCKEVSKDLEDSAKLLENSGSDFIIIACNTAHRWAEKIKSAINIPVLDMIEETALHLKKQKSIKTVGLIASRGTIISNIYKNRLHTHHIDVVHPDSETQEIFELIVQAIKSGNFNDEYEQLSMKIKYWFEDQAVDRLILACSELPIAFDTSDPFFIDPIEIIAKKSILFSGATLKEPQERN